MSVDKRAQVKDGAASIKFPIPDIGSSYEQYIESGLYDRRYPRPNRRTLRKVRHRLAGGGLFLDFGAGTGRYTKPLIDTNGVGGVAYDICKSACATISARMAYEITVGRLAVRSDPLDDLVADYAGKFDVVLLGFGVLSHIPGESRRREVLSKLRRTMKPGGWMLVGVPNARRRLWAEQRAAVPGIRAGVLEKGDVLYTRKLGLDAIPLFHHLYRRDEICADLDKSGFEVRGVQPESLFPEEHVVNNALVGWLDDMACRLLPASIGYCILIEAMNGNG